MNDNSAVSRSNTNSQASRGGIWSTIESLLGPLGLVVGVMALTILILLWRGSGRGDSRGYDFAGMPNRVKLAAYDEMWRGEEAELWKWLEERVGEKAWMGHEPASGVGKRAAKVFDGLDLMAEQEVSEAIRVTKEKLGVLEDALRVRKLNKVNRASASAEQKTSEPVSNKAEV